MSKASGQILAFINGVFTQVSFKRLTFANIIAWKKVPPHTKIFNEVHSYALNSCIFQMMAFIDDKSES